MMKQHKTILLFLSLATSLGVIAQDVLVVDGASITTQNASIITVQGNVVNNTLGTIDNAGTIYASGDWENNGGNTFLINNSNGTVELNGSDQSIKGSDVTDFYNLSLTGTSGSIKTLNINANIDNELNLGSDELQTENNIVYVNSTVTNAISWNGGYVSSSDLGGYLVRKTLLNATYVFPVGSSNLPGVYRAVKLTPNNASANAYGVRLAAINPGNDNSGTSASGAIGPFDETSLGQGVKEINTLFYHNIYQFSGTSATDVAIDYFSTDGIFLSLAQWNENSFEWEDRDYNYSASSAAANLNNPNFTMSKTGVSNFDSDAFAFQTLNGIKVPGGLSPNNDGENDEFYIEGLEFFLDNELVIFNRWGDEIYKAAPYQNNWKGGSIGGMVLIGNEIVDGTYFYILKLGDKVTPLSGSFELKR